MVRLEKDRFTVERSANNSLSLGPIFSSIGVFLYILLNWSYTTAVFTDPGSPSTSARGAPLSSLPTREPPSFTSLTVKSTGEIRFCKKCAAKKPDRAHHCSTCRRCVLKMDHHCPWLATCVGLRNYKAFVLFLIYLTSFCWVCFAISASWLWGSVVKDGHIDENMMPVHFILLAVLSGIIGLVIGGFAAWHVYLTTRNQTTIESLEKTRYLSPLRAQIQTHLQRQPRTYVDQENHTLGEHLRDIGSRLTEIHANALPGVLRPEEGEERTSPSPTPAQRSLRQNLSYSALEAQRERDRYTEYLDEQDSEHLPNAFDLGWWLNAKQVFGPNPLLWWVPICNSEADGWTWELSQKWLEVSEDIKRRREAEMRIERQSQHADDLGQDSHLNQNFGPVPSKADRVLGRIPDQYADGADWSVRSQGNSTPLQRMSPSRGGPPPRRDEADEYESSSDEEMADGRTRLLKPAQRHGEGNWNDVPDHFFDGRA